MSVRQSSDEQVFLGRPMRLDRGRALDLLRRMAAERGGMRELRQLFADEMRVSALSHLRDEVVLQRLAERIASGGLTVALVWRPEPKVPVINGESKAAPPVVVLVKDQFVEEKPTTSAQLSNPRWSVGRVEVGEEVEAIVTYSGFKPENQPVTLSFFEWDADGARKKVGEVTANAEGESGDLKVKWKRDPESAKADLEEDQAAGEKEPLDYRFMAEAKGVPSAGESGTLYLTNTVTVKLTNEGDGEKHDKPQIVVLRDYEREQRVKSQDGEAKFEKVLVGPVEIRLAEPKFTDLKWSAPKVPVGEPVEALFKYEDAIEGMKVSVVVHEFNADGSSKELEPIDVELSGAAGEGRASFTRSEDEAQEDLAEDQQEGDTGPLEYRYYVALEDGSSSEASEPLFLTHNLTLKLENAEDGVPFEDGLEFLLLAADGTEHRAKLGSGEVKFEAVVCGPMTVKLAPPPEEVAP